jgi:hypothetical protein
MLHADLSSMLFPVKYKVFFYAYAQEKQDSLWLMDPVRWIFIPPPEIYFVDLAARFNQSKNSGTQDT